MGREEPKKEQEASNVQVNEGQVQIIEREVNLSLINDKLNLIISMLSSQK